MARERTERIPAFGGMDDSFKTSPQNPELLQNVYVDEQGTIRTCGAYSQVSTSAFSGIGAVSSLTWFSQHNGGRQWTVFEHVASGALTLSYVDYSNDALVTIQSGRTLVRGPWAGTTYLEHGDWLYAFNGYDKPIRWNGKETLEVGFSQAPPPPIVTEAGLDEADAQYGTSLDRNGYQRGVGGLGTTTETQRWLYGYVITWVNDRGQESPPSAVVWLAGENPTNPIAEPQGLKSVFVEMPEAPVNIRGVRLYRTVDMHNVSAPGAEPPVYLVKSFAGAGRMHFIDDHGDAELGPILNRDASGLWPDRVHYAQIFKDTLFVAGPADNSRIRYSTAQFIEQMPSQNFLFVGDSRSGEFMGFKSTRNALIVFKRRGIYLIKGDPLNGFYSETLTEDVGCSAPRSIVEIHGLGTMFVSDDGPQLLEGALENTGSPTRVRSMVKGIAKVWRTEVNKKALLSCRAVRYARDREVWLQVPTGGDDRAKLGLILHVPIGGWSIRRDFPFSCMAETRDHRALLLAGSWDSSSAAGILVYSRGFSVINGVSVSSKVESAWLGAGHRVTPYYVQLYALNTGRNYDFEWHADRDARTWSGPSDTQREFVDSEYGDSLGARAQWGTATWDTDYWEPLVPIQMRNDPELAGAFEFQFRITSTMLALTGYDYVFVDPLDIPKRGQE